MELNGNPNYSSMVCPLNPLLNPTTLEENTNGNGSGNDHHSGVVSTGCNNAMNNIEEFGLEFPPGYRFCPEDGELIVYYLQRRIMNRPLPHDKFKDVNLYLVPPHIASAEYAPVEENEWYFFTPRDRKYPNGSRPDRGVGKDGSKIGYWKATGGEKDVHFDKKVVGSKKSLVYYQMEGIPPKGVKTNWIMHEFRVTVVDEKKRKRAHQTDKKLDDWVLCRIYNKTTPKSDSKSESEKSTPESGNCTRTQSEVKDEEAPQAQVAPQGPHQAQVAPQGHPQGPESNAMMEMAGYADNNATMEMAGYADNNATMEMAGYADNNAMMEMAGYDDNNAMMEMAGYADNNAMMEMAGYADNNAMMEMAGYADNNEMLDYENLLPLEMLCDTDLDSWEDLLALDPNAFLLTPPPE